MTTMTLSLLVPQAAAWFAIRGAISSAPILPIWMFYSWVVPTACGTTSTSDGDGHEILSTAGDDVEGGTATAAAAATGQDDNVVDWESTMAEASSSSIENDELLILDDEDNFVAYEGEDDEDEDDEEEYNPNGLQIWPNGKIIREDCCNDLFDMA